MGKKNHTLSIYALPSMTDYYANLSPFLTLSMFVGVLLVLLNLSIFFTTASNIRKRLKKPLLKPSLFLTSIYTVAAISALTTILVPKSWLICHTVMHLSFTVAAPIFHYMCFLYVGAEQGFLKENSNNTSTVNTPPCCCCCMCLPSCVPTRLKLTILRYMIWQMPLVQGTLMLVLNIIYYKDPFYYDDVLFYFIPFIFGSILSGIWALNITVRLISTLRQDYRLKRKLFSLQCILLLCKLQYLILDSQLDGTLLSDEFPINHTITKQTIINLLILCEMVFVSLLAQSAYRVPVIITEEDEKSQEYL